MTDVRIIKFPPRDEWDALQQRAELDVTSLYDTVRSVLEEVRQEGDSAVLRYCERFDHARLNSLKVTDEEFAEAAVLVGDELKQAIAVAAKNIETFHAAQRFEGIAVETTPGVRCRQKASPIEKVGLYIPGGTAPLFSTVLMLAIPARIAGCKEIALCSPPNAQGKIHPAILYSAQVAGVRNVFKAGGIQAIGAMTYGTDTIPKVYKIFGPGNQYVTAAKQLVSMQGTAIDMPAGPSEVAIIADADANPRFIAADFLSQAEHGADSQSLLLTTSFELASAVRHEIHNQLESLPRRELTEKSLVYSKIIVLESRNDVIDFTNQYAPEHLIIQTSDYMSVSERIVNAGSIFLGSLTPESAGDYASGTNHTLPTKGFARMYSGVNLDSFIKKITLQEITSEGFAALAPVIEAMASAEMLEAHRRAVSVRRGFN